MSVITVLGNERAGMMNIPSRAFNPENP